MSIIKGVFVFFVLILSGLYVFFSQDHVTQLRLGSSLVNITRDAYGIPFIKAPSYQSALYAWGYVSAEDRLFQMSFKRVIGQGRLSEYLGEKTLKVDQMFRELGFRKWANRTAEKLKKQNATEYQNLLLFCQGINDFANKLKALPIDFQLIGLDWQDWTVEDFFLMTFLLEWPQSFNYAQQYLRSWLLSRYSKEQVDEFLTYHQDKWFKEKHYSTIIDDSQIPQDLRHMANIHDLKPFTPEQVKQMIEVGMNEYLGDERGSNSWIIAGEHTQSGKPINVNDPHLDNAIPTDWYQIRLQYTTTEDSIKVNELYGATNPGCTVYIGKTGYFTTALTTTYVDTQDLYKEKIQDQKYFVDGKWHALKKRVETIKIKGQQPLAYTIYQTHRGPVISYISYLGMMYDVKNESVSLAWNGFNDDYEGYINIGHCGEVDNFDDLHAYMLVSDAYPNGNALISTVDGHIAYYAIGKNPIRANAQSGMYIKSGETSEHDWLGFMKAEHKLRLIDPERGFIVTGNNAPSTKAYLSGYYEGNIITWRANRITEMILEHLKAGKKISIDDVKAMQLDTIDSHCQHLLPYIFSTVDESKSLLKGFDCNFTMNSYQASIYQVFFNELMHELNPAQDLHYNIFVHHQFVSYISKYIQKSAETADQKSRATLAKAWASMKSFLQAYFKTAQISNWKWSQLHRDVMHHRPFSKSSLLNKIYDRVFAGRGNMHTVNVGKMQKLNARDYNCDHRANLRTIMTFSEEGSYWHIDSGASQRFFSKHYTDQMDLFINDRYISMETPSIQPVSLQDL